MDGVATLGVKEDGAVVGEEEDVAVGGEIGKGVEVIFDIIISFFEEGQVQVGRVAFARWGHVLIVEHAATSDHDEAAVGKHYLCGIPARTQWRRCLITHLDKRSCICKLSTYHLSPERALGYSCQLQSSQGSRYLITLPPSLQPPVCTKIPSGLRPPDEHHGSVNIWTKESKNKHLLLVVREFSLFKSQVVLPVLERILIR